MERIGYLIKELRVDPAEITGVTFTNKAAAEIRSRLVKILADPQAVKALNLGTFHSLAWRILKFDPLQTPAKLLDEMEARGIIEDILRQKRIPLTAREAALNISLIKNEFPGKALNQLPSRELEVYQAYQDALTLYRRCDYDDLIVNTVALWETNPDWLRPIKPSFKYLLIDEFQDINALQYRLIKLWAADGCSLMVIGDPNQSIYGFRGASAAFFEQVQGDFPTARLWQLTGNYRSPGVIIQAANALVDPSLPTNPEPVPE